MATPLERAEIAWPGLSKAYIFILGPLGSRYQDNELVYNRKDKLVTTGVRGKDQTCFHGTLEEFETSVERVYGEDGSSMHSERGRIYAEYKAALAFLRSLPDRD